MGVEPRRLPVHPGGDGHHVRHAAPEVRPQPAGGAGAGGRVSAACCAVGWRNRAHAADVACCQAEKRPHEKAKSYKGFLCSPMWVTGFVLLAILPAPLNLAGNALAPQTIIAAMSGVALVLAQVFPWRRDPRGATARAFGRVDGRVDGGRGGGAGRSAGGGPRAPGHAREPSRSPTPTHVRPPSHVAPSGAPVVAVADCGPTNAGRADDAA